MIKIKIYDCSNSDERPRNREYGGPVENAVVTMLKKYGHVHGVEFVDSPEKCDVLFTNDVYPEEVLELKKPKVKRMDGIFWQEYLKDKNIPYNRAAEQSDYVIFISGFSRRSLFELYEIKLQQSTIITNWVDSEMFYPSKMEPIRNVYPRRFVAIATSWKREEKRLRSTLAFAEHVLKKDQELFLVGNPSELVMNIPSNVTMLGYVDNPRNLAEILRSMDAAINLSYRDACPKVILEEISCGLPVIYTDSGGAHEVSGAAGAGVTIHDFYEMCFESQTPELEIGNVKLCYEQQFLPYFPQVYQRLRERLISEQKNKNRCELLVEKYCNVFKTVQKTNLYWAGRNKSVRSTVRPRWIETDL